MLEIVRFSLFCVEGVFASGLFGIGGYLEAVFEGSCLDPPPCSPIHATSVPHTRSQYHATSVHIRAIRDLSTTPSPIRDLCTAPPTRSQYHTTYDLSTTPHTISVPHHIRDLSTATPVSMEPPPCSPIRDLSTAPAPLYAIAVPHHRPYTIAVPHHLHYTLSQHRNTSVHTRYAKIYRSSATPVFRPALHTTQPDRGHTLSVPHSAAPRRCFRTAPPLTQTTHTHALSQSHAHTLSRMSREVRGQVAQRADATPSDPLSIPAAPHSPFEAHFVMESGPRQRKRPRIHLPFVRLFVVLFVLPHLVVVFREFVPDLGPRRRARYRDRVPVRDTRSSIRLPVHPVLAPARAGSSIA
eukprot:3851113-Rhodomonas_salina.1